MKARIRRLSVSVDSPFGPNDHNQEESSTVANNGVQNVNPALKDTSRIERMRKLLSSPLSSRRKSANALPSAQSSGSTSTSRSTLTSSKSIDTSSASKIFGVPLSSHSGIPYILTRLCSYIETESGLQQEGLFRISGNVKLIDRLKNSFDLYGDAPLEEIADVPSAAALIKLYLRELPKPVIPSNMHQLLFTAAKDYTHSEYNQMRAEKVKQPNEIPQEERESDSSGHLQVENIQISSESPEIDDGQDDEAMSKKDKHEVYVQRIKSLISILPSANFYTLRYLCSFLHRVSQCESSNRMNAASLGIVFGPTIFRISTEEYSTLGDKAIDGPNQVVTALITECHLIFDRLVDPSYSTAAATVVLLDPQQSVILSGTRKSIPSVSKKTKKGASIDLCDLSGTKLHHQKRNFSQEDDETVTNRQSNVLIGYESKSTKKKIATIVPIVVLNHTDDDIVNLNSSDTMAMSNMIKVDEASVTHETSARRKRYLSSTSANLIRSVSEERSVSPVSTSFDSLSNELRRCASSDNLIRCKSKSSTLAAVVAATTASLLFPSYTTLTSTGNDEKERDASETVTTSTTASASAEVTSSLQVSSCSASSSSSPSTHSPSSSDETNSNTQSSNTVTSMATITGEESGMKKSLSSGDASNGIESNEFPDEVSSNVEESSAQSESVTNSMSKNPSVNVILTTIDNDNSKCRGENNLKEVAFITQVGGEIYDKNNNNSNHGESEKSINVVECASVEQSDSSKLDKKSEHSSHSSTRVSITVVETFLDEMGYRSKPEMATSSSTLNLVSSTGGEVEAPVSPSAYRSYLTRRTSQSLLSVAPSPPLEQDNYSGHSKINLLQSAAMKSMKRQMHQLKGQIREFEMDFKCKHGYPPSMEQKMNSIIARPALIELNKLKKSLKDYKYDTMKETLEEISHLDEELMKAFNCRSVIPSIESIDCEENILAMKKCSLKKRTPTNDYLDVKEHDASRKLSCNCLGSESDFNTLRSLEEQLQKLQESMKTKRSDCSRPEDITRMTAGQIMDEKSDLQRELLKFESIYGHPDCERHRHIMRPIYDRYRSVKRLVASMPAVSAVTVSINSIKSVIDQAADNVTSADACEISDENDINRNNNDYGAEQVMSESIIAAGSSSEMNDTLEPIPENVSIDFKQSSSLCCSNSSSTSNSCSSTSSSTKSDADDRLNGEKVTLSSTTNATIVAISPSDLARIKKQQIIPMSKPLNYSGQKKHSFSLPGDTDSIVGANSDIIQYHEMSLKQLIEQLNRSRSEKKQLQRIIRNLEDDMRRKLGRKIEKEDRIQPVYITYKQAKGKLRLLKALVAKSEKVQHTSRMSL